MSLSWNVSDGFFLGETRFVDSGDEGGRGEVPSSHRIKGTYCQQDLILVMSTLVTWPGLYEPPSPGPSLLLR